MLKNNLLIHSDNLLGLNYLLNDLGMHGLIDLVYIDPPFSTGNVFRLSKGRAQSISMSKNGSIAYTDKFTLESYLDFIKPRVELIYKLLSERGSLYFHIDYKIGHYVKVMLDDIFGISNFRSSITRVKCNPKNFSRRNYGNIKDMILFYTKGDKYIWNDIKESVSYDDIKNRFKKLDVDGRRYTTVPIHAPGETVNGESSKPFMGQLPPDGRHWRYSIKKLEKLYSDGLIELSKTGNMRLKCYADDYQEKKVQDIWEYKDPQKSRYPTEKNSDMMDYIVKNSSDKDSIVLDCFCGSGTTLASAMKFGRKFVGIDESKEAIIKTKETFNTEDLFNPKLDILDSLEIANV